MPTGRAEAGTGVALWTRRRSCRGRDALWQGRQRDRLEAHANGASAVAVYVLVADVDGLSCRDAKRREGVTEDGWVWLRRAHVRRRDHHVEEAMYVEPRELVVQPDVPVGHTCLLYTSPSPRDGLLSRMP